MVFNGILWEMLVGAKLQNKLQYALQSRKVVASAAPVSR